MLPRSSGLARQWPGLCAAFLLLGFSPVSLAQPADAPPRAEAATPAAPPADEAPPPGDLPPPGYLPPPGNPPPGNAWQTNTPSPAESQDAPPAVPVVTAQPPAPASKAPRPYSLGATLSSSIHSETGSTSWVTSPLVTGAYAVHSQVVVDLALGFGWLVDNQGLGESTFRAGNPQLAGHYHTDLGPWRVEAGLGVTAPLAHVPLGPDGRLYESLYNRTLAMWGMWNQWLWLTDRMAAPAIFRASYAFPSGTVLVVQQADALVFGVVGNARGTDFVGQLAFEAQMPISSIVTLCPRLQTVLLPQASLDRWQSAAGLRATFQTGVGRFFASFLVALDEPIAAQRGLDRWGFHLGKEIDL